MTTVSELCRLAKRHGYRLSSASLAERNAMLKEVAAALRRRTNDILTANASDLRASADRPKQFLDRLKLDEKRIEGMATGIEQLIALPDPLNRILDEHTAASGIEIRKISVPFGTVAIIYEARPNVTADCIGLCLKSGNALVLRGSKDALTSNRAIVGAVKEAFDAAGFDAECIQLIEDTTHEGADELMRQKGVVDVLIPRGGANLIRNCVEHSLIPVIETGTGNCHVYVERTADLDMAEAIILNAKLSRPSVCNACESVIVDRAVAAEFVPRLVQSLSAAGVEVRADEAARALCPETTAASDEDFDTEYLGYVISLKVLDGAEQAVEWINEHSTHHSEAIVTRDERAAALFTRGVDSAAVYVNASTRFTDGFEFGLGAEMGISTQKLHARGPMGLNELTSYKFVVRGSGQTR